MSVVKQFVLDANVFIEAQKHYYAFDLCPGFWSALVRQHKARRICSIDRVKAELVNEKLKTWVGKSTPASFFKGTESKSVVDAFEQMVNWVQDERQFTPAAKAEFSSVADGWLVAFAKANGRTVVTLEAYAPDARKKVMIPNICEEFGVDCCDTFEMLRDLKEQFGVKKRGRTN